MAIKIIARSITLEYWDIYDVGRQKTGRTIQRGSRFEKGEFHMVVHVCIFNSNGEMLIQQRQPFKEDWSGMWDVTVGGSAVAGETSAQAAQREVSEEIGYKIDLSEIRPHLTINFNVGFDDIYIIEDNIDISKLKLQYEEVKQVKWAARDEIIKMIDRGEFIPYHKSMIELLFAMYENIPVYGTHIASSK